MAKAVIGTALSNKLAAKPIWSRERPARLSPVKVIGDFRKTFITLSKEVTIECVRNNFLTENRMKGKCEVKQRRKVSFANRDQTVGTRQVTKVNGETTMQRAVRSTNKGA